MVNNSDNQSYRVNEHEIKAKNTENAIYFNFSYSALKLLGKNLYSTPANAISELVANALDARAPEVYVYIDMSDKEHSIIEILDNGSGMSYDDLADKYVWIGRNKRNDATLSNDEKQTVMGRKGIGKLAALFLSNQYYIITKQKNDIVASQWEVNLKTYDDSEFPRLDRVTETINLVNQDIWNTFSNGTVIKLENVDLRGNGEKKIESLRRVFADFYLINALSSTILVAVKTTHNQSVEFKPVEKKIGYKNFYALYNNSSLDIESKMQKSIAFTWNSKYRHIANKPRATVLLNGDAFKYCGRKEFKKEDGTMVIKDYSMSGWIAIHCTIEQSNAVDSNFIRNAVYQPNHLRLYVRNKLAVENYFNLRRNTQAMANYIEGEISFDILDDDDLPDIATSSRQDFLADERIELLSSIVDPILSTLFKLRNKVGHEMAEEDAAYTKFLIEEEEKKRKAESEARAKAEEEARANKEAKDAAEAKQKEAEAIAAREIKRSRYILSVSDIEDKNIMNSVHSIYNMSNRVKENLDEINNLPELSATGRKKLAKAATSNQRILSVSKLISKAGRIIDDNDAVKQVDLPVFVEEYVRNVLCNIYQDDIEIRCDGDLDSSHFIKIKPLSFIMMIDNLIGNSIKANAKLLTVIIDNSNVDKYQIIFKDNGRGIDPTITNTDRLFEFGVTTTNGSGLGLYYAQKYIDSIHGKISIKNNDNDETGVSVVLSWKK